MIFNYIHTIHVHVYLNTSQKCTRKLYKFNYVFKSREAIRGNETKLLSNA